MRLLTLLALVCSLSLAAAADDDANKADKDKLQGTWQMVSITVNGEEVPADDLKEVKLVVKADNFQVETPQTKLEAKFTLDPEKKPKAMDVSVLSGKDKGKTFKVIYALEGDTFKTCRPADAAKDRPTEFSSKQDSGLILTVWKRAKS